MHRGLMTAIIILPGTVLVFVPAALLFPAGGTPFAADVQTPVEVTFYVAVIFFTVGGYLSITTARLFKTFGEGTPAPWEPPKKLGSSPEELI